MTGPPWQLRRQARLSWCGGQQGMGEQGCGVMGDKGLAVGDPEGLAQAGAVDGQGVEPSGAYLGLRGAS
jgi:hypothetical protein